MTDFASVLDDMYANTPVTLSDVKEMPIGKAVSTDPALPRYAIYIGLGLVFLVLLSLVVFRKKEGPEPLVRHLGPETLGVPVRETLETIDIPEPVKRDRLTFQITEALVTAEESFEDEKISADREDLVLQKYKERMA
jgi:hypothetical protein